ncbi:hypothetical protein GCM10007298_07040 [Williamsia phyllosphaerae]|uniref:Uncharacterized protein n=1 Tax=Williamsia phyllosphaerae TaxID=885042 RepID=A0ABQ1UB80_9NOCA|nr:hypothetical protein GCM10007298_07040 [Williamsia phyllosphaerae]
MDHEKELTAPRAAAVRVRARVPRRGEHDPAVCVEGGGTLGDGRVEATGAEVAVGQCETVALAHRDVGRYDQFPLVSTEDLGTQQIMSGDQRVEDGTQLLMGHADRGAQHHGLVERGERGPGRACLGQHRCRRDGADGDVLGVAGSRDGGRGGGDREDRAPTEHVTGTDPQPPGRGPARQGDRGDAVATEGEEVVVDTDAVDAQDGLAQLGDDLLALRPGIARVGAGGRDRLRQ